MFSKVVSATAVALAASQLVSAQTFTACNPMQKACPDDPALGTTINIDFTKGATDFFDLAAGTIVDKYDPALGAEFTIAQEGQAPTMTSNKYIFFGSVSVVHRAAPGIGIVSSIVLQSDDLDEIDWEWLGGDKAQVQTNYFGKGDTTTYDRGAFHPVANPQDNFYNYTIDWTPDHVSWLIDGTEVRRLNYNDAKGGTTFPQTPCQLKLGIWVGGSKNASEGTVQWAGGYTDFSQGPFTAYYKSVTVRDYHQGATKYVWPAAPNDGSWQGIQVVTGGSTDTTSKTTSASSTASSSGTKTTLSSSTVTTPVTQATGASNGTIHTTGPTITPTGTSSGATTSPSPSTTKPNAGVKPVAQMGLAAAMGGLFLAFFAL